MAAATWSRAPAPCRSAAPPASQSRPYSVPPRPHPLRETVSPSSHRAAVNRLFPPGCRAPPHHRIRALRLLAGARFAAAAERRTRRISPSRAPSQLLRFSPCAASAPKSPATFCAGWILAGFAPARLGLATPVPCAHRTLAMAMAGQSGWAYLWSRATLAPGLNLALVVCPLRQALVGRASFGPKARSRGEPRGSWTRARAGRTGWCFS